MNIPEHDKLVDEIGRLLDRSVGQLDPEVSRRLDHMRREALAQGNLREAVNESNEDLLMAVKAGLDDSVDLLEPKVTGQLDSLRIQALERARQPADSGSGYHWAGQLQNLVTRLRSATMAIPVSAFATACVLITATTLFYSIPGSERVSSDELDVLLIASNEDMELYENLEFYLWLADNDVLGQ